MRTSRKKREPTYEVLVDIGSASIGVALVEHGTEARPRIVYAKRESLSLANSFSLRQLVRRADTVLARQFANLRSTEPRSVTPRRIHVVFGAPWYRATIGGIRRAFEAPQIITDDMLTDMQAEAAEEASKSPDGARAALVGNEPMLENDILQVLLNGYPSEHPIGSTADTLAIRTYTSFCVETMYRRTARAIEDVWGPREVEYHSAAGIIARVLGSHPDMPDSFVLCVVGGETTELLLVRRGILGARTALSGGVYSLVRSVADARAIPPDIARMRLMQLCTHAACDDEPVLEEARETWRDDLAAPLGELAGVSGLPHRWYVLAERPFSAWFRQDMAAFPSDRYTVGRVQADVAELDERLLCAGCTHGPGIVPDPLLSLYALATRFERVTSTPLGRF